MLGIALIILGAIFLLKNLGILAGIQWDIIWPIVIIAIGIAMVSKKRIM
ncbi:MAG: DUF5668 domain-containing protein [Candidatus Buchananbacteria bacterium]|jgi:hypothetical protein